MSGTGQSSDSVKGNAEFFARDLYGDAADTLDSHERIRAVLTEELRGTGRLLDAGNGGVFEYDTSVVDEIVASDLFLDESSSNEYPENVTIKRGDALALDEEPDSFDVVLEGFLYHHLTGERAADSLTNIRRAISEARRVTRPGGRLLIAESCIPAALYPAERLLYQPLRRLARTRLLGGHPATLQLPVGLLTELVAEQMPVSRVERIELGRWVTQFGRPFPTALSPVRAYLIEARKPMA